MHAMKVYEGVGVLLHSFLISTLGGGKWSALYPRHFTLEEIFLAATELEAEWTSEPF
jgi:hypothetical protein